MRVNVLGKRFLAELKDYVIPAAYKPFVVGRSESVISFSAPRPADLDATVSQLCTARQMVGPRYERLCAELGLAPRMHRKQWEFVYILRALEERGALAEGRRGLGFGCGTEPLPAVFAARGATVVATDSAVSQAVANGWTNGQHSRSLDDLNDLGVCPPEVFRERVSFEVADMNAIPRAFDGQFDFVWSACALEHLGSIARGLDFFVNSMRCLRPGGVAVHTTEFNLTSDSFTLDDKNTVLFRRSDIEGLCRRLASFGYEVAPLNLDPGDEALDRHIDVAPYSQDRHLRLLLDQFVTTSIGVIARKP